MPHDLILTPIQQEDFPQLERLAELYLQNLAANMGRQLSYEDYSHYLTSQDRRAYFIEKSKEVIGFVLINKACQIHRSGWNIAEFFIAPFWQNQGLGLKAARAVWELFPGEWEVSLSPGNTRALQFWAKAITQSSRAFQQHLRKVDFDLENPERVILTFHIS